jgi:anti-sigma-K factor RskA
MTEQDLELVGEYVLGLLEGEARSDFERRMDAEPEIARAVTRLRQSLQSLDDTAGTMSVDPTLWPRIEAQLGSGQRATPAPVPRAANDNSWMRRMGIAASLLVALGIGFLSGTSLQTQPQPIMIAVLINEADSQPGAIVEAYADDTVRLVPLDRFTLPQDRVFEVWTLPDADTGPVSLGTFNDPKTIRLAGPNLPRPQSGQLYEITLEPMGGSPTGRPTGPILVKGFARSPL